MKVFTDTSAMYAVMDRDDEVHAPARDAWASLLADETVLLTSNYVLLECFALIQSRLGIDAVRTFQGDILPVLDPQWIDERDHHAAAQAVLAAGRRDLSLVDCSSFQIMRQSGVGTAFAFDRHFEEQGFDVLPSG